jgi:hypothetical protein
MFQWVYEVSTGMFLAGGSCEVTPAGGQGVVSLTRNPNPRLERYNGTGGIRKATLEEISDYDTVQVTAQTLSRFDGEKLVKALAIWTAGKLNVPIATAKQEILQILRGL